MTYLAGSNAHTFVNTSIHGSAGRFKDSTLGRRAGVWITVLLKYRIFSLFTGIQRGGLEIAEAREDLAADGTIVEALAIDANSTVGNRNTRLVALACLDLLGLAIGGALVDGVFLQTALVRKGVGADLVGAGAFAVIGTTDGAFGRRLFLALFTRRANLDGLRSATVTVTTNVDGIRIGFTRCRELGTADGVSVGAGAVILLFADVGSGHDDTAIPAFLFHLRLGSRAAALVQCVDIKATLRGERPSAELEGNQREILY